MEHAILEKLTGAGSCREAFETFARENPIPEFLWVVFLMQAMGEVNAKDSERNPPPRGPADGRCRSLPRP